ncbi:hypothetical protein GQ457_01G025270 [Hibiscus cannabinus]
MENPNENLGLSYATTTLHPSGRPPDAMIDVNSLVPHERSGSPLSEEVQRATKRGKNHANLAADSVPVNNSEEEHIDTSMMEIGDMQPESGMIKEANESSDGVQPSFRDILAGHTKRHDQRPVVDEIDVEVLADDVQLDLDGAMPVINFSERVHSSIDKKLENSVIVRLLGKSIGYRALLNRIEALWKPKGEIKLIDLDNDYYLVRFALEEDCDKVLSEGPWVIYGSYLTVQPWSRTFSIAKDHPSKVMVWVRLPGLPYRYYTKSLFRYIALALGEVVRIDYNTTAGNRGRFARLAIVVDLEKPLRSGIIIDGQRQSIEYEGLPTICYSCGKYGHSKEICGIEKTLNQDEAKTIESTPEKDELYGPWMQVTNRRRRNTNSRKGNSVDAMMSTKQSLSSKHGGSRFSILTETGHEVEEVEDEMDIQGDLNLLEERRPGLTSMLSKPIEFSVGESSKKGAFDEQPKHSGESNKMLYGAVTMEKDDIDVSRDNMGVTSNKALAVASKENIILGKSNLDKGNHSVVRVMENNVKSNLQTKNVRVLPPSITHGKVAGRKLSIGKGLSRGNTKPKKPTNNRSGKSALVELVESLSSELDKAHELTSQRQTERREVTSTDEDNVQWRENSTFETKLFTRIHKPDIFVVLEPRISDDKADLFIRRLQFDCSYRVEAEGFSGGIWVMWRKSIKVDVIAVSNQFIHGIIQVPTENHNFFFTFIYASPARYKRRDLWEQLMALNPRRDIPWALGGDLNVIGNSTERRGGSGRNSRGCPIFADFMFKSGLMDMGFSGPEFTWNRGDLYQRLDRFICNSTWYSIFPASEVHHLQRIGSDHCPILLDTGNSNRMSTMRPYRFLAAWNDHPSFNELLESSWSKGDTLEEKISWFQQNSSKWNSTVFGHIGKRKSTLLARLRGIEKSLVKSESSFLLNLESELKAELDEVLKQEESFWQQKSRTNWVSKGDRNTAYFHASTMIRRRHNTVRRLELSDGQWCNDTRKLKSHALQFYQSLFSSQPRSKESEPVRHNFHQFSKTEMRSLWRGLNQIWEDLRQSICWNVRNGHSVDFWYDNWFNVEGPLASYCPQSQRPVPTKVADMVTNDGNWNVINNLLPHQVLRRVSAVIPPNPTFGSDTPSWRWEENRLFSSSSAYNALEPRSEEENGKIWKLIWSQHLPQRIRVFLWLAAREALLTNVERVKRHITSISTCELCGQGDEDVEHILRRCPKARLTWASMLSPTNLHSLAPLNLQDWIAANLGSSSSFTFEEDWPSYFAVTCWQLWKRRCSLLFNENYVEKVNFVDHCIQLARAYHTPETTNVSPQITRETRRKWSCPTLGWIKLNVDGAMDLRDGSATIGGVIRDDQGNWIFGFSKSVGICSVLTTELWAILVGLRHVWRLGFRKIEVETDNVEVARILDRTSNVFSENAMALSIGALLTLDWDIVTRHIPRTANGVADRLAKLSRGLTGEEFQFTEPPAEVAAAMLEDLNSSD